MTWQYFEVKISYCVEIFKTKEGPGIDNIPSELITLTISVAIEKLFKIIFMVLV